MSAHGLVIPLGVLPGMRYIVPLSCRYEALVPGRPDFAVQYKEKIFCFAGEAERDRFMRCV